MAHLIGARVVFPDIQEHKFSDGGANTMLSREILDLEVLERGGVPHLLLEDLRHSWNGELDAVLFLRDEDFPRVTQLVGDMGLKAPPRDKWLRSPVSATRGCSKAQVEELRKLLAPYRYVAMLCYDDFALNTHKLAGTILSDCGANECCRAYKERSTFVRLSPTLYQLAGELVRGSLGSQGRFIAGHIRPMPDSCIDLWASPKEELTATDVGRECRTVTMHSRFVPNIKSLQQTYNITTVFIMGHPKILPRVFRMLQAAGIKPVSISMSQLNASIAARGARSSGGGGPQLRTPLSVSLLALVEEAVAVTATAFLGTGESSMTGTIVQERLARGQPPSSMYFMAPRTNCSVAPCALTLYSQMREKRLARLQGKPGVAALGGSHAGVVQARHL